MPSTLLENDALGTELASVREDGGTVLGDVLVDDDRQLVRAGLVDFAEGARLTKSGGGLDIIARIVLELVESTYAGDDRGALTRPLPD